MMNSLSMSGFEHQSYGFGESAPVGLLLGELFLALGGEAVELCVAAIFGFAPFGPEPAAVFQAVERGIERALLHLEDIAGDLPDAQGDAVAVDRTEGDDLEDKHVERALEQIGLVFLRWHAPLLPM